MTLRPSKTAGTCVAFVLVAGCARHLRVVPPGERFRIVQSQNRNLILPPPVADLPANEPFSFRFPVGLGSSRDNCGDSNELFNIRVDRKKRQLAITLPAIGVWQGILPKWEQPDQIETHQRIAAILNSPQSLEKQGCLSESSAVTLRQILRDAIPSRAGLDLDPSYGYSPAGVGLELKSGVRLKIQRAHFRGLRPANGERPFKDLDGISTVYYECQLDSRERILFGKPSVQYDSDKLKALLTKGWEDTQFARQARPQPIYRLFLFTSFLKKGVKRSALVLGASGVTQMQALDRQIASDPSIGCDELKAASCTSFEGDVTVSSEIRVTVNGKAEYLDWGTTVRAALRRFQAEKATDIRLRRTFHGKSLPVVADAKAIGALEETALVAGDELTWRVLE